MQLTYTTRMSIAISVENLTKRYHQFTALNGISFQVPSGQIMGFLGPNGAGKTTTLRILTGMLDATSGKVTIDGISVAAKPLEARKRIGYLPENVALYPELRVIEYLNYRAAIKGVSKTERKARIQSTLERCQLADVQRKLIGQLSKGYRQRVALADCLLGNPSVLILDEPTVGLDPNQIRQTRDLIKELGKTTTILLSTHILPEVEMLCDEVTIIHQGRIIATDSPADLRSRLKNKSTLSIEISGDADLIQSTLAQLPGITGIKAQSQEEGFTTFVVETSGADVRQAIFQTSVHNQWVLRELASAKRASLEDVFVSLTTHEALTPPEQPLSTGAIA